MSGFDEFGLQIAIVERLCQKDLGWTHVVGANLARTPDSVLIEEDLIAALLRLNPVIAEKPERVDEVLPTIRAVVLSAVTDGLVSANERMVTWMRGAITYKFIGTDDYVPIRLIDFDNPRSNRLVASGPGFGQRGASTEVTFGAGTNHCRFDIVLWINGLPVVVGETKTPVDSSISWLNGANDIHVDYEVQRAPFFVPNILNFATEGREFHYGAIRQIPQEWLLWGSTADPYDLEGLPRVMRSVELLLSPEMLLSVLRDFTLFDRPFVDGKPAHVKLIPRYPQVEGANAIHERVLDPKRNSGLLWHYQGTGKTLLSAFSALQLLNDETVGGPTVLIVLDRLDLVEQTERQFRTVGLPTLKIAKTKKELQKMLNEDARGIIVTTIFRFGGAGFLNGRNNIIVLVDEADRTQDGDLGEDMRAALPNAQFFGLTGTPIVDSERNTFKLFGEADDPGFILSKYSMERSIADGSSVPVHVENRLVNYQIDKVALDEAFAAMAGEASLTEEEQEKLMERAAKMRTLMHNPERIKAVCEDIVEHYLAKVYPLGLKAQIVAFDRELCTLYYEEITRLFALRQVEIEAAVVMTVGTTKSEPVEWKKKFELDREKEVKIKARFTDHSDPLCFLIVTAKLLRGFDAPNEGVMYLDKALRRHTLFQAITRTNRRWTNPVTQQEKLHGLIVDYIGLGDEIGKALQEANPESGGRRPVNVKDLVVELEKALNKVLVKFNGIPKDDFSFETLTKAQQRLPKGSERDGFAAEFMVCQGLWEFLSPSRSLAPFKDSYRWLAKVYESIKPTTASSDLLWQRLGAKTLELIHGATYDWEVTGASYSAVIIDEAAIEVIRGMQSKIDQGNGLSKPLTAGEALDTIAAKLKNLSKSHGNQKVYAALSWRLERLRQVQLQQVKDSVAFLREILELARQVTAVEKAEEVGEILLDPNVGALTQIFKEYAPSNVPVIIESVVEDIDTVVRQARYSHWNTSHQGDREVRREIRAILKKYGLPTTGELFERAYGYIYENY